jgi:hypothetical protein
MEQAMDFNEIIERYPDEWVLLDTGASHTTILRLG